MKKILFAAAIILVVSACSKNDDPAPQSGVTNEEILNNYVNGLVLPNLKELNEKATAMNQSVLDFINTKDDAHLETARQSWYSTRTAWEQSEAMLFGPVEDNNFDPRIDSWPVDYAAIQTVWGGAEPFTEEYINSLADELKGFHPIEFILFGKDGDAKADDISNPRQIEYLKAMSLNLAHITDSLYQDWQPAGGNFAANVLNPGTPDSKYNTEQAAFIEIANAMIAIVDEVGTSKLKEPFDQKDPSQEESPFSKNSFTDFKNNITGAQNVYLGRYGSKDGAGLSDFVAKYNKALDNKIQKELDNAIQNLAAYQIPYGTAIVDQRSQVQASMDILSTLHNTLEQELIPLIQLKVK